MKCKKFMIESNGTSAGTKIWVDDMQLGRINSITFDANLRESFVRIQLDEFIPGRSKKIKIRDEKTQKFVEKEIAATQPILIEFVRS